MDESREAGVVVSFDATKGFGFIRSKTRREDLFVHKSAITKGGPLQPGRRVSFRVETSDRGPRAADVQVGALGLPPARLTAIALMIGIVAATLGLHEAGLGWFAAYLGGLNLATWPIYAWDKHRAVQDRRRVPELLLLGLALVGGSPGAALAMLGLHHKTQKPAFYVPFLVIVLIQVVAVGTLLVKGASL